MNMEYQPVNSKLSFPADSHMGWFSQTDQADLHRQGDDMT